MPAENLQIDVATIIKSFLSAVGHQHCLSIDGTNENLENAMKLELRDRNIVSSYLERTVHLAASLIELAFKDCTFEEKKFISMYNWFILYIDDECGKNTAPFIAFQQRFIRGLPQLDPVLDAFAALLNSLQDYYDALAANIILSATLEFIGATCAESQIKASPALKKSTRFPGFLRDRTGLGISCAVMIFPKSRPLEFVTCFQALPDMNFWIAGTNDILSFYKEQLEAETTNYIYSRANAERKEPLQVLLAVGDEVLDASENVSRILSGGAPNGAALTAWRSFELGFMTWHLQQDRYKLKYLSL